MLLDKTRTKYSETQIQLLGNYVVIVIISENQLSDWVTLGQCTLLTPLGIFQKKFAPKPLGMQCKGDNDYSLHANAKHCAVFLKRVALIILKELILPSPGIVFCAL